MTGDTPLLTTYIAFIVFNASVCCYLSEVRTIDVMLCVTRVPSGTLSSPVSCVLSHAGVDAEFEKLLGEIFGIDFIETFKAKRPAGWVDLMIAFESRKRAANPHKTSALNVSLPFSFIDFHKKHLVSTCTR